MAYKDKERYKIYQKNYQSKKITCECGKVIINGSKRNHIKTEKHKLILKLKETENELSVILKELKI